MHIVFLPGSAGAAEFWHPLGALLPSEWKKTYLSWPGLGNQPHDPTVNGFDDLVNLAAAHIDGPVVVVAQSMGGIVGVRLALTHPAQVTHLVLVATSGGIDVAGLGAQEWRDSFLASFPQSQRWITTQRPDHSADLPGIACPTLLIWGERDPISPPAVGERLDRLIGNASLHVINGGMHDVAREKAQEIAPLVVAHITGNHP